MQHDIVIKLENAAIHHGKNESSNTVLSDVNISMTQGELVYLIGRVGSGKSSLMRTLYAELPLGSGNGYIAGFDLARMRQNDIPSLRRRLGIIFQDYKLLGDRDIYQNLLFVLKATGWRDKNQINAKIEEVLDLVKLSHKIYKMPFQLSGGEQQRLCIARALLNDPLVILADEPTGNLDPAAAEQIIGLFHTIAQNGCAVMVATHNLANIQQYPSRTLRFSSGQVDEIDIEAILGL